MPARTSHAAVIEFRDALRRALACVTDAVLQLESYRPTDRALVATLNQGDPLSLDSPSEIFLVLRLQYRIVQDQSPYGTWAARIAAYYYALQDARDNELLAYHWHPEGRSRVTQPHLHVGRTPDLPSRVHLPTGKIGLEDVLQLAIEGFGVAPRRTNWEAIFQQTRRASEG